MSGVRRLVHVLLGYHHWRPAGWTGRDDHDGVMLHYLCVCGAHTVLHEPNAAYTARWAQWRRHTLDNPPRYPMPRNSSQRARRQVWT